jgi:hypothetical protein
VVYPQGSIGGAPNTVRALQWSYSTHVRSNPSGFELLDRVTTDSITIVHPGIQTVEQCVLPQGRMGFAPGEAVVLTGYVTNCGDINLTNVIANGTQAGRLVLNDPVTGSPLATNTNGGAFLAVGSMAIYRASYVPTLTEASRGFTTNSVTVTATDTSEIGGPSAAVSDSTFATCPICVAPCVSISMSNGVATIVWSATPGQKYRVQYRQDLNGGTVWSNLTPDIMAFAFSATNQDNILGTAGQRFYRVVTLP